MRPCHSEPTWQFWLLRLRKNAAATMQADRHAARNRLFAQCRQPGAVRRTMNAAWLGYSINLQCWRNETIAAHTALREKPGVSQSLQWAKG